MRAGPRKACERRRRTEAAMKAVKPSMARRAKPARAETGVVWNGRRPRVATGRTVKIKAGLARRLYGRCCRDQALI